MRDLLLTILMLATFALFGGGLVMIFQRHDVKRGLLMIACALVCLGNAAILSRPLPDHRQAEETR